MRRLIALTCGAALLSACAGLPAGKPFTGDRQSTAIHELSVAVLIPHALDLDFSGKSFGDIVKLSQAAQGSAMGATDGSFMQPLLSSIFEPERFYRGTFSVYFQDFKKVELVSSVEDPRVAKADLLIVPQATYTIDAPSMGTVVAVLILTLDTGGFWLPLPTQFQVRMSNAFYAPDHSLIATLKADSPKVAIGRPALFPPNAAKYLAGLHELATTELDRALENSPELAQYAKSLESKNIARAGTKRQTTGPSKTFDSDVDKPGYGLPENHDNYAVVIGVEKYQSLPAAPFARRDAETMRAHLGALGYPAQNIALLTDAQATGNKMKSYLESWLPKNVKPNSKVLFYFSGHGAPDPDTKQGYLVPWDGDPQFISDTGYPLKRLYKQLNDLKVRQVVVAMDSCFSGAGGRSVLAKGARPLVARLEDNPADLGKVVVLEAAGGEEVTGEEESQGHGLFTYYLLKGLNEKAGQGSVGQLYGYLKPKVEAAARQGNRSQSPQLRGAGSSQDELTLR